MAGLIVTISARMISAEPLSAPRFQPAAASAEAEGRSFSPPSLLRLGFAPDLGRILPPGRGDIWFRTPPPRNVVFAGADFSAGSRYFSTGFKRALTGTLHLPGYRLLATAGLKIRERTADAGAATARVDALRAAIGYEWHIAPSLSVTALAGASLIANSADIAQRTRRLVRPGALGIVELWQDWGSTAPAGSRFTSLFAIADSGNRSTFLKLRHGFGLADQTWRFGPEVAYGTGAAQSRRGIRLQDGWRKARIGGHISEIPLLDARLAIAGGFEARNRNRRGGYADITAYLTY